MVRNEFQDKIDNDTHYSTDDAKTPLPSGQTVVVDLNKWTSKLSDNALNDNNDGPDNQESLVGEDVLENVDFIMNLSGADHVEDLTEDE